MRSFSDASGDGIGDLRGVTERLDYFRWLGVDAIWLTPFFRSPQHDHGYDVSDYTDVDPLFGSMADFDALLARAHELDMRVVLDIVPNHTSIEHQWFINALSSPSHPDRARYVFRDAAPDGGPPNPWQSVFGGSAWELDAASGQYFLHTFAPEQPDLDWRNRDVRGAFLDILRFWLKRGVDGFRIDVAELLGKVTEDPDGTWPTPYGAGDQSGAHDIFREWRSLVDSHPREAVLMGEIWVGDHARYAQYLRPDELHLAFNFDVMLAGWDSEYLRARIDATVGALSVVGAPSTWVLGNHDRPRPVARFGAGDLGRQRTRAVMMLLLALPGPMVVYQGDELGLDDVDLPDEVRQDPMFIRTNGAIKGRDNCRLPMPWSSSGRNLGFAPDSADAWLPMPRDWATFSVATQREDEASALHFYRRLLALRRDLGLGLAGSFSWLQAPDGCLGVSRQLQDGRMLTCVMNMSDHQCSITLAGGVVARTGEVDTDAAAVTLGPNAAAWAVLES